MNGMNVWLITDTHLGHKNLPLLDPRRPLDWEDRIFSAMRRMVPEDSTLVHLGDVALGGGVAAEEANHRAMTSYARANILVRGNHDKRSDGWYYNVGWDLVVESLVIRRWGYGILFSHKPMPYSEWGTKYGRNIHGHTHGNGHRSEDVGAYMKKGWNIELALENTNYQPIMLTDKLVRG